MFEIEAGKMSFREDCEARKINILGVLCSRRDTSNYFVFDAQRIKI